MMKPTVVIGTTFVDIKGFSEDKYDPLGRNLGAVKFVHGGVGRNVAQNFANVGMPVSYVGMLEDSPIGREVEDRLKSSGADLRFVMKAPKNGIGKWLVILDEKGDMAGSISMMPDISYLEEYLKNRGDEIIREAGAVVLEVDLSERIAEMIIGLAKRYGKDVYAIVGNMSVILARRDLIKETRCFICNEVEAAKFFGCDDFTHTSDDDSCRPESPVRDDFQGSAVDEICARLPVLAERAGLTSVVVTLGERGAVYYDGASHLRPSSDSDSSEDRSSEDAASSSSLRSEASEVRERGAGFCPPCPTDVVDTSGAGDAFFSGTVMGLIRGAPLSGATRYGAILASRTISRDENSCPVDKDFFRKQGEEICGTQE